MTCVVGGAEAGVVAHSVHTGGVVLTAVVFAVVDVHFTEGAVETEGTRTTGQNKNTNIFNSSKVRCIS